MRKTISSRVHEAVKAIALVHNVTPVYEANGVTDQAEAEQHYEDTCRVYQAASPDEVTPRPAPPRPPRRVTATGQTLEADPGPAVAAEWIGPAQMLHRVELLLVS